MQKRILIADIDADFLTRLEVLFEDKGYCTTTAWGGRVLLRELQSKQFDLILLSDYLPDIDSEELWRSLSRLAGSAFVALLETSHPVEIMASHYLRAGGHCVLLKASPYKIVEAVCGCLGSGESHQLDWTNAVRAATMKPRALAQDEQSAN